MTNTGGRPGGAVTAAVFLKQFAGELPWLHLDIAGTAWTDDAKPWQGKGATGAWACGCWRNSRSSRRRGTPTAAVD